jgi:hypothetical protein
MKMTLPLGVVGLLLGTIIIAIVIACIKDSKWYYNVKDDWLLEIIFNLFFIVGCLSGFCCGGLIGLGIDNRIEAELHAEMRKQPYEEIEVTGIEKISFILLLTSEQHPERLVLSTLRHSKTGTITIGDRFRIWREKGSSNIDLIERVDQLEENVEH